MGTYSLDALVRKWSRGELTVEQVVGQLLLHVKEMREAIVSLERRVYRWPPEDDAGEEESQS